MPVTAVAPPPQIREGDRLNGEGFLRRWEAMPELKHAELINGTVFFTPSPVSLLHSDVHTEMIRWLLSYDESTPGCQAGVDCTWKMGPEDVPQPDLFLRILPEYGGQSRVEHPYAAGAPELIVEVSGSSLSRDSFARSRREARSLWQRRRDRISDCAAEPEKGDLASALARSLSRNQAGWRWAAWRWTAALARVSRPVARSSSIVEPQTLRAESGPERDPLAGAHRFCATFGRQGPTVIHSDDGPSPQKKSVSP